MTLTICEGEIRKLTREERKTLSGSYKWVVQTVFTYTNTDFANTGIASDDTRQPGRQPSSHVHVQVPLAFLTDGASGGGPDYGSSWLFHDWLYATHEFTSGQPCTRKQADKVMYQVLKHDRLHFYAWGFKKLAAWNPFWVFSRAWKKSGSRGTEFLVIN